MLWWFKGFPVSQFISSRRQPHADPVIVISSIKDVDIASETMKPLPLDRKNMTKVFNKLDKIQLAPDERLAMVDSGSLLSCNQCEARFAKTCRSSISSVRSLSRR